MKKKFAKTLSISLCAALLTGAAGSAVYAGNSPAVQTASAAVKGPSAETRQQGTAKDETVYVLAGADGRVEKIIVSDWLKNTQGAASIVDSGELDHIEALKPGESYTMSGNARVWDARGGDVYYQGNADKELPVSLSLSYRLDGREISPEELAGKSGKLTIRFDYENTQYETVEINGEMEKIYVPFAMMTGMVLDSEVFSNVEVSNGRLVNDGSRTIVAGIAFPGLQESLGLDADKLEIPDYVEITADVQGFRLANTITIAANSLFNRLDTGKLDSAKDLTGSLDQLTDAMGQLMDGSSALYQGLCTLLNKSGELIEGIDALAEGAGQLQAGSAELRQGAETLAGGAKTLADGLSQLDGNSAALQAGSRQVFDSLLAMADSQLASAGLSVPKLTPENYGQVLDGVIASLNKEGLNQQVQDTARKKVSQAVDENWGTIKSAVTDAVETEVSGQVWAAVRGQVEDKVTAAVRQGVREQASAAAEAQVLAAVEGAVRENVTAQVLAAMGMTKEEYDAGVAAGKIPEEQQAQVSAAVDAQMGSESVQGVIAAQTAEKMASGEIQERIDAGTEAQMATEQIKAMVEANVSAQLASPEIQALAAQKIAEQMASSHVQSIILDKSLEQEDLLIAENMGSSEVQEQIAQGLKQAESGLAAITALKGQLDSYNAFYTGLAQYTAGVSSAKEGAEALQEGASALHSGAGELDTGVRALCDGVFTLKNSAPALTEGVTQLRDGALRLSEGLEELNEKGIQKLLDAAEGDLAGLTERIKAVAEASKNYDSFSGLSENMEGKVKFVYRTEAVE